MVHFYTLFNSLSKNISNKQSKLDIADELAKGEKKNEIVLNPTDVFNLNKSKNLVVGYSKRGKKGINQDCFIVIKEFGCREDAIFCGVFDGHGPWGHLVAKRVQQLLPSSLLGNWSEAINQNSADLNILELDENRFQFEIWKQSYFKTCAVVDKQVQLCRGIDSFYSGSTALTLVRQGDLLIMANVGDCRAVLATSLDNGSLRAIQLTADLKPNVPRERKRIEQSRGKIFSCSDESGVYRLWTPGHTLKGPGLAVSRAFGDYCLKDFGLISEPEVTLRNISTRDQFVILATDGVWDVLSNQEAVDIVASTLERAHSAKRLVESAVFAWKVKGRAATMDDISAICVFLN